MGEARWSAQCCALHFESGALLVQTGQLGLQVVNAIAGLELGRFDGDKPDKGKAHEGTTHGARQDQSEVAPLIPVLWLVRALPHLSRPSL